MALIPLGIYASAFRKLSHFASCCLKNNNVACALVKKLILSLYRLTQGFLPIGSPQMIYSRITVYQEHGILIALKYNTGVQKYASQFLATDNY